MEKEIAREGEREGGREMKREGGESEREGERGEGEMGRKIEIGMKRESLVWFVWFLNVLVNY